MAKVDSRLVTGTSGPTARTFAPKPDRWRPSPTALRPFSIVLLLVAWSAISQIPWAIPIPSPLNVINAAARLDWWDFSADLALSAYRVAAGFLLAALVGIPLGICIGYSAIVRDLVFPAVELFRPIPPIAWIPLAILFFPKVEWMIIFLTYYGSFFPIVYNTVAGVSNIRGSYVRAGKSLGASELTLFWHVVLPAALPSIFTGLYIAIGVAWLMVVAGEMIANKGGVGALTWQSYQTTQYPLIFVGMAAIGLLGYVSSLIVRGVAHLVVRWEA